MTSPANPTTHDGQAHMHPVTPHVRHYQWGSRHRLALLTGRPAPTPTPEAELWFGTHPDGPCAVPDAAGNPTTLEQLVRADPALLGAGHTARFGPRLPYLLKVLAVERTLSIQCHPSTDQVRSARPGTYLDDWGKPEAVVALSDLDAFAGTLPYERITERCRRLGLPGLTREVRAAGACTDPVAALLRRLLRLPEDHGRDLAQHVARACRDHGDDPALAAAGRAARQHPGDVGALVLLTLAFHRLRRGDVLDVPPGTPHAYQHGTALEIQAASDNVVRAGLTPKPTNASELLRIMDTRRQVSARRPEQNGRMTQLAAHAPDFRLERITAGEPHALPPSVPTPRIALAAGGEVTLTSGGQSLSLRPGAGCFLPAYPLHVTVSGPGDLYLAGPG